VRHRAASLRPIDPTDAVLAANQAFYEAFEARDLDAMSEVWEHSDRVMCTHPGWATLRGWASVSASFFAIFQGGSTQFILTRTEAEVNNGTAWVAVDENILGAQVGGTAAAVNIFSRSADGRWRMVVHHASTVLPSG
jgi:ketosteroid isomerase-like protein